MSNTVTGAQDVAAQGSKVDPLGPITRLEQTRHHLGYQPVRHRRRRRHPVPPINAGMGGFWPLVAMALLVGPMTYLAHRGLARSCFPPIANADITEVVEEHFGTSMAINHPALLLRHLPHSADSRRGHHQTVESFLVNQLQMTAPPRWILPSCLIMAMSDVRDAGARS